MPVLLTGYEPFGEYETNPSGELASRLDGTEIADVPVVGSVLPVSFERTGDRLTALIDEHRPDAVVSTGLAGGRHAISVERVGLNVNDCVGTPDNDDAEPHHRKIDPDGPVAHESTLPVARIVETLVDAGVPARLSNTAGTHLCNHALYRARAHLEATGRDVPAGFVHLPLAAAQAARRAADEAPFGGRVEPSLPLSLQETAIELVVETTLAST